MSDFFPWAASSSFEIQLPSVIQDGLLLSILGFIATSSFNRATRNVPSCSCGWSSRKADTTVSVRAHTTSSACSSVVEVIDGSRVQVRGKAHGERHRRVHRIKLLAASSLDEPPVSACRIAMLFYRSGERTSVDEIEDLLQRPWRQGEAPIVTAT